jgi:hypothetical protein
MKSTRYCIDLLVIAAVLAAGPSMAKDDPLEFLHAMQKEGFADIAIDYLNDLKNDPNAPPEVLQLWDLEMSKSMREKAKFGAYNAGEAKQLNDQAKALMEKFLKNNPTRPEAIKAAAEYSTEEAIQAQYEVLRAQAMTDKAEKAATLAAARATFEKILQRFVEARDSAIKHRSSVVNSPRVSPKMKQEALFAAAESRLRLAMVEFYIALTQDSAAERDEKFAKVAPEFERIYQEFGEEFVGYEAHYWNARILLEEGRNQDARDYLEEVQAHDESDVPDSAAGDKQPAVARTPKKKEPEPQDYFFSEVERQLLKVLYTIARSEYYKEVKDWRRIHGPMREKCPEFQGLTLDYARHMIDASNAAKDDAMKSTYKHTATQLLTEMTKISGPYQRDAVEVLRQLNPKGATADSFDFLTIDADKAVESKDWATAAELYGKALAAATPKTEAKRVAAVRNAYVGCIHNQAMDLYNKKKIEEAVELIKKMLSVPEYRATAAAPAAALFALNIQYYQLLEFANFSEEESKARDDIQAKVVAFAKSIIGVREWTDREEADSARIILLRVALSKCDLAEAKWRAANTKAAEAKAAIAKAKSGSPEAKTAAAEAESAAAAAKTAESQSKAELADADHIFKGINPASRKYPEALTILGWKHWQKYRVAKRAWDAQNEKTPPDKATQDQWDDDRKHAVEYTKNAVDVLDAAHAKGSPMSKELRDAKTLLAEMYAEGRDAKLAIGIYQDLVDNILSDPATTSLDDSTLRVFNGAVQAYLQLNDMHNASAVATKLLELGADEMGVNMAIINFAKRLELARKQAATEVDAAGNPPAAQQSLLELESKIMINLAKREKLAAPTKVWIVQVLSKLGSDDADTAAAELARRLIDLAQNDNNVDKQIGKAKAGLHTLAANILAKQGNYEKAADEVKTLIDQFPKALAPQMSRAQILTLWAAKDPSKYGDAIRAWNDLAGKLERVKVKGQNGKQEKMPEYYEAFYNECLCFYKMADKTKDKSLAKKALDLMTPALSFDPKLHGPDRDRELTFKFYQLAGKLADYIGEPKPTPPRK